MDNAALTVNNWLDIGEVSRVYDIDFDVLCGMVTNGTVKAVLDEHEELIVDLETLPENLFQREFSVVDDNTTLLQKYEALKQEYEWLKSESMRNDFAIKSYHEKFMELKHVNHELLTVINEQSHLIRELKGYTKSSKEDEEALEKVPDRKSSGISLWMFFPMFGLLLTALFEIYRTSKFVGIKDVLLSFGVI